MAYKNKNQQSNAEVTEVAHWELIGIDKQPVGGMLCWEEQVLTVTQCRNKGYSQGVDEHLQATSGKDTAAYKNMVWGRDLVNFHNLWGMRNRKHPQVLGDDIQ